MNDVKDLKKSLPATESSFIIDLEGMVTGKQYQGEFACKIPNIKDQAAIAKHRAMLNGGFDAGLDIGTKNMHHMISYLRYTLTLFPKWWKEADLGYALFDPNIVEEVYAKVLDFEKTWLESVWGPEEKEPDEPAKEA